MKFNAAVIAVVAAAATVHGAAVEADDFSDLDSYLANIPTDALSAAQASIAAGVQPTADVTTPSTPAESSEVAAVDNADDGLPSEEEIDKLIASADAKFGPPGDNKGLPAPPAAATATAAAAAAAAPADADSAQATPRNADQPAPDALEAIKGAMAFAQAAAMTGTAPVVGSATTTAIATASGNGTVPTPSQVLTAAAAPRQAAGGLAIAAMIAAYFW